MMSKQKRKKSPLITRAIAIRQRVSELVLSFIIFDLDVGVQLKTVTQPI